MRKADLSELKTKWPSAVVARTDIRSFTGGLMSERYIANLDSQGQARKGVSRWGERWAIPSIR